MEDAGGEEVKWQGEEENVILCLQQETGIVSNSVVSGESISSLW